MPWWALGLVGGVGLVTLLVGVAARVEDRDDGEKRFITGCGMLGAALLLAIAKAAYLLAKSRGWL